jgi:hypothetical protein
VIFEQVTTMRKVIQMLGLLSVLAFSAWLKLPTAAKMARLAASRRPLLQEVIAQCKTPVPLHNLVEEPAFLLLNESCSKLRAHCRV